jgi:hypothetical protein
MTKARLADVAEELRKAGERQAGREFKQALQG